MRNLLKTAVRFVAPFRGLVGRNIKAITVFLYEGSDTSFVSAGETRILFGSDGWIVKPLVSQAGKVVTIGIENPNKKDYWQLEFAASQGAVISKGSFKEAVKYPLQPSGLPGLSFSGCHRDCNNLTGEFDVLEAVFEGNQVISFAADFVQYDESQRERWNWGSIRYNSRVPIHDVPTRLNQAFC